MCKGRYQMERIIENDKIILQNGKVTKECTVTSYIENKLFSILFANDRSLSINALRILKLEIFFFYYNEISLYNLK